MKISAGFLSVLVGSMMASAATPLLAQDSFGAATPAASTPQPAVSSPASMPAVSPSGYGAEPPVAPNAPASSSAEMQDYGIAAQDALRPTESLHAPTPTSVPGARTVDTQTLASMLRDPQHRPLVFHVLGSPAHLPGAIQAAPAGRGGSFDDAAQREFGEFLKGMSRGDSAAPMVFYCGGTHCWMSYNAALRAVHLGYRNVAWYRGGIEAWSNAGLPVEGSGGAAR